MNYPPSLIAVLTSAFTLGAAFAAEPQAKPTAALDLSKVLSKTELESVLAGTANPALKQALTENADAIMAAAAQHPHVQAVIRTLESAPGQYTKVNTTPESLKKAAGGEVPIFDTLTLVSTHILGGHAHANRDVKEDPYDAAFIEHLGHIPALESVRLVTTQPLEESWLPPLYKLENLKALTLEKRSGPGQGLGDSGFEQLKQLERLPKLRSLALHYVKATDAGLAHLAGLKNLESFSLRGSIPGHAFAKFEGWTNLKTIAFHGNAIDDEGLGYICERFPNLEHLNLIHARALTDASAVHVLKLKKLKSIILNGGKMTAAWHRTLQPMPLESLSVHQGNAVPAGEAIAGAKAIPTLRRFAMEAGKQFTDEDLTALAGVTQLENLSIGALALTEERVPLLKGFSHLKKLEFVNFGSAAEPEKEAKIRALLPKTEIKFTR